MKLFRKVFLTYNLFERIILMGTNSWMQGPLQSGINFGIISVIIGVLVRNSFLLGILLTGIMNTVTYRTGLTMALKDITEV